MTARDRRALLLGLGTVTGALILLRVVPAGLRAGLGWRARVEVQQQTLARQQALIAVAPMVRDSLGRALTGVVALAPRLVAVGSVAEASASLASIVSLAATRHALKVLRLDPLPDSAAGVFTRVAVRAELEGDVRGVVGLLRAVEVGEPVLTVLALTIDAPQPTTARGAPEVLRCSLTIAGYAMRRAG